jgi:hypothetical protein
MVCAQALPAEKTASANSVIDLVLIRAPREYTASVARF